MGCGQLLAGASNTAMALHTATCSEMRASFGWCTFPPLLMFYSYQHYLYYFLVNKVYNKHIQFVVHNTMGAYRKRVLWWISNTALPYACLLRCNPHWVQWVLLSSNCKGLTHSFMYSASLNIPIQENFIFELEISLVCQFVSRKRKY